MDLFYTRARACDCAVKIDRFVYAVFLSFHPVLEHTDTYTLHIHRFHHMYACVFFYHCRCRIECELNIQLLRVNALT